MTVGTKLSKQMSLCMSDVEENSKIMARTRREQVIYLDGSVNFTLRKFRSMAKDHLSQSHLACTLSFVLQE